MYSIIFGPEAVNCLNTFFRNLKMEEHSASSTDLAAELTEVENELYDRQIRLWGLESQKRLRTSKILVSGLGGIGAEVTKNIILSGVHSVMLHDDKVVAEEDFCSQFLVFRNVIGLNRATASVERARDLNPMVEISTDTEPLEKKEYNFFCHFDVIVISGGMEAELIRINNICRLNNIKFFCTDVWGTFGYCCAELQNHMFLEDIVKHQNIRTSNKKNDTRLITTATTKVMEFPSLQEVFDFNHNSPTYQQRVKRTGPAFVLLRILQKFRESTQRDPSYKHRDEDFIQLEGIRNKLSNELDVPSKYFFYVFNQISPCAAVIGGVVAQEVIKAISKKEAPLYNIFLFDPESCCGFIEYIGTE